MLPAGWAKGVAAEKQVALSFGVCCWRFGVWPAAGASSFRNAVQMKHGRCAGPNTKHQTSNNKL